MKKAIIISVIIAALAYGGLMLYRQKLLLANTTVKFQKIDGQLNFTTGHVIVSLAVVNNSDLDITLKGASCNAYLNSTFISTIKLSQSTAIAKHSSAIIDVVIDFDPSILIVNGLSVLLQPGAANLIIEGSASITSSLIVFNSLPIKQTIPLNTIIK